MASANYDVLVIGGGNAALCAALSARQQGARVLLLECAPRDERGGNTRHIRNLRCMHDQPVSMLAGCYSFNEYMTDLQRVTQGQTDEKIARVVIEGTAAAPSWLEQFKVRFQAPLGGTLNLGRTNLFYLGGGKALLNSLYLAAERLGVDIRYDSEVVDLVIESGQFVCARVASPGVTSEVAARAVVVASGGFESNLEWLREAWGEAADNFIIRGTRFNRGVVLKALMRAGAATVGDPMQCHAVAIDARAPRFDGGIVTRLDCVPFGVVVNSRGQRFYDEGEEFWPKRYAIWGRLVAQQPGQRAVVIIDSKAIGRFMPSVFPAVIGNSIAEIAEKFDLPAAEVQQTVADFNRSVRAGSFDHTTLDDCFTEGLVPPKSHWARRIDTPPYYGYPLRPGITFTYLGVKVDRTARVQMLDGSPSSNIFAAGEMMAGNVLGQGYIAGIGMAIGTVYGRIAGAEAARHAA